MKTDSSTTATTRLSAPAGCYNIASPITPTAHNRYGEGFSLMKVRNAIGRIRSRFPSSDKSEQPQPGADLVPFAGYEDNRNPIKFVEMLSDEDLSELNLLLDWKCFVADSRGRRFGNAAWAGKRCEPQPVPNSQTLLLDERFGLSDKHVLEIGCFEGVHTVGLAQRARRVTAVDSRVENVVKTIVRCAFFGQHPTVFKCDVESLPLPLDRLKADIVHHVGVLYHLRDPARHLRDLGEIAGDGILLDTHFAAEGEANETYESDGRQFRYKRYQEYGHADPFSGMYDHSKWLLLEDISALLNEAGFAEVEVVERRAERNGPRALLLAHPG